MNIRSDQEADATYIALREATVAKTKQLDKKHHHRLR